jgi:hypothetical protein
LLQKYKTIAALLGLAGRQEFLFEKCVFIAQLQQAGMAKAILVFGFYKLALLCSECNGIAVAVGNIAHLTLKGFATAGTRFMFVTRHRQQLKKPCKQSACRAVRLS